ncbi:D-alanyl-D-alanine carboxypeptidase/D-alanyl-D-alanine endopeptidase [Roseateles violae]|uniref:D-alanyl-D-alanine carboxypeptidase/D-alanyl-D-alanine-endopeptidase n=1 Tax=Roseateles violae TaxID=3058042 RepID=A0ABT8DTE5_9BURK|nr:D-alanyl-D-alanine carboxypeptidase/D-alanyl-D-alanine-endopeptidase [Pelomonas sp. PFR6]MDN3919441.1 D-alanyl-D-alanine carboxypeptidase/D-alanyl-D-alanine-endopeptidase [Pelomonas sp. PFR6]
MRAALSLLAAGLLLAGCATQQATTPPTASPLPAEVRQALDKAQMSEGVLGIVAFPLHQRDRGLRFNAERPMQPASTMKLLTSIVALDRLGANARGRTDLLIDSTPVGDVLPGALYLRGGADTDLDWGALHMLLRQLREAGLREIRGGLVVDRTLFRPARMDIGVPRFDEQPEFQYNVIPDALQLNTSVLDYTISADAKGISARVSPAWPGIEIDARGLTLNELPCKDWENEWRVPVTETAGGIQRVRLLGTFPRNCTQKPELNLVERQWLTATAVRQLWRELGGTIAGGDREAATPEQARIVASHRGRPLAEVLRGMMKSSDNPATRLTYLRLGAAVARAEETTLAASERVVRDWFAAKGLDAEGLVLENGSGLSRIEKIKPAQLAGLLAVAWDGRQAPELLGTLPIAGVDGTLSRRLKGTPAEGRARLKTGTLHSAVALAGYVPDAADRPWIVVAMLNDELASKNGRPVIDALVDWVARQR